MLATAVAEESSRNGSGASLRSSEWNNISSLNNERNKEEISLLGSLQMNVIAVIETRRGEISMTPLGALAPPSAAATAASAPFFANWSNDTEWGLREAALAQSALSLGHHRPIIEIITPVPHSHTPSHTHWQWQWPTKPVQHTHREKQTQTHEH